MNSFVLRNYDSFGDPRGDDRYIVHAWSDNDGILHVIKDNGEHLRICEISRVLIKKNWWESEVLEVTKNVIFNSILAKAEKFWFVVFTDTGASYGLLLK